MKRRRTKKELRIYERHLAAAVERCLRSPLQRPTGEHSEAALLLLRRINNVVFLQLRLARTWPHNERFLEYLDLQTLARKRGEIHVGGEFVWWPLRKDDAAEAWWPDDRLPRVTKYGGKYLPEPFEATMRPGKSRRRRFAYKFEFGVGKTRRLFTRGSGAWL